MNTPGISGDEVKDILSPVDGLALNNPNSDTDQLCPRSGTSKTYSSKYKCDSDIIHIMEEVRRCYECGIGFKRIGILSPEERLEDHEQTPHLIDCKECENHFISDAHLKYHIETFHDARCADCCSFCNRTCTIQYAAKTELTGERAMENGLADRRDAVGDAMEDLGYLVKKKTKSHMTVFEDIARRVDVGFSGPEAIQWSRLVYLQFPKMLEKDVSNNVKTWVLLSEFEMALDKQIAKIKRMTVKKCPMQRCNLSFTDEWTHRWDFHPDSSSHHWASGPEPFAFLKATSKTMPLKEGSSLKNLDAQAKKETEADNSVINMETHEEPSDPISKKESEKGYSKRDTDPRQVVEPASNEKKRYLYNHNKTIRSQAGETR